MASYLMRGYEDSSSFIGECGYICVANCGGSGFDRANCTIQAKEDYVG